MLHEDYVKSIEQSNLGKLNERVHARLSTLKHVLTEMVNENEMVKKHGKFNLNSIQIFIK